MSLPSKYVTTWRRIGVDKWEELAFESLKAGEIFKVSGVKHFYVANTTPKPCEPAGNYTLDATRIEIAGEEP